MERWQLIVIVLAGTGAWYLYKRFVKKEKPWEDRYRPPQPEVENWYNQTMATVDDMDEDARNEKEAAWDKMTDSEKLQFSEKFMRDKFGQKAIEGYNRKQRIQIGLAQFIIGEQQEDQDE